MTSTEGGFEDTGILYTKELLARTVTPAVRVLFELYLQTGFTVRVEDFLGIYTRLIGTPVPTQETYARELQSMATVILQMLADAPLEANLDETEQSPLPRDPGGEILRALFGTRWPLGTGVPIHEALRALGIYPGTVSPLPPGYQGQPSRMSMYQGNPTSPRPAHTPNEPQVVCVDNLELLIVNGKPAFRRPLGSTGRWELIPEEGGETS